MKTTQIFEAEDGTTFPNAEECRAYEADAALRLLVGLTIEDVKAAVTYQNKTLAKVIEATARRVFAARIEAGDISPRGGRRKKAEAPSEAVVADEETAHVDGEEAESDEPVASDAVTPIRGRKKAA